MKRLVFASVLLSAASILPSGCRKPEAEAKAPGMQGLPVGTETVSLAPVQQTSDFVSTIKSRRSVSMMPQVDGNLTQLLVKSGDRVHAGQLMMQIDPRRQQAVVDAQVSTESQKKALYDYNTIEIDRQRKLFAAGVTSRDTLDQAEQSYNNSHADWQSAIATRKSLEQQLDYYRVKAPFDGIVGDVPVHLGDYVTPTTALTTVDENKDLEVYIYVPAERAPEVRNGLAVTILDNSGNPIESTAIDFVSPEVNDQLQGILAKAPVRSPRLRTAQLVTARVVWNTSAKPVIPVLAVTRLGGQAFVYLAENQSGKFFARQHLVTLGDTVGNNYAVLGGLKSGDRVIVSGTQLLQDGMPVIPMPVGPPPGVAGSPTQNTGN